MLDIVAKLFNSWNIEKIRYCHWKSSNHLRDTVNAITDVDVLVDRACARRAESLLTDIGFQRLDTVILRSYPGIMDYVCLDLESGRWVHIHLHYQLTLGDRWAKSYWLPLEDLILSRAKYSEDYSSFVIDPHDELYIFCARMSLKHKKPFNIASINQELKHIRSLIDPSRNVSSYLGGVYEPLDQLFQTAVSREPSPQAMNKLAGQVRHSLAKVRRFGSISFFILSTTRMLYRYLIEFRRRILHNYKIGRRRLPRGGALVAFVGIDGSGKSSGVGRMEKLFAQQMNVANVFLGNGRSGASWYRKVVFLLFGAKAKWKSHKQLKEPAKGGRKHVPWYYALWILVCLRDKEKNLKRAIRARANGSLVLSDRWPQSQVSSTHDGPRIYGKDGLGRLAMYVAMREKAFLDLAATFPPDLVLRFQVSSAVASTRKPGEFTEAVAEHNAKLLDKIVWEKSEVVDIDADGGLDTVDQSICAAIWSTIQGKRDV